MTTTEDSIILPQAPQVRKLSRRHTTNDIKDCSREHRSQNTQPSYFELPPTSESSFSLSNIFEGWPLLGKVLSPSEKPPLARSNSDKTPCREKSENLSKAMFDKSSGKTSYKIHQLFQQEDVKEALVVLHQAISYMCMLDTKSEDTPETIARVYSEMIITLCEPKVLWIMNTVSGLNLDAAPQNMNKCIVWQLFIKVVQSGYILETCAYLEVIYQLMQCYFYELALQTLYFIPRRLWDTDIYKLAITLHQLQRPRQTQHVEWLLEDYGKSYLEITSPLSAIDASFTKIDTPLMAQASMGDIGWSENQDHIKVGEDQTLRSNKLSEWAMKRLNYDTLCYLSEMNTDNVAIYTSIQHQRYEEGWSLCQSMEQMNKFTPRVIMYLCWKAHQAVSASDTHHKKKWGVRALDIYKRFMFSQYLTPHQPELIGFLNNFLSIYATGPEQGSDRYATVIQVYHLLEGSQLSHLLREEHILIPIMYLLLQECHGPPSRIMKMSFCLKSGDVGDFMEVVQYLCHTYQTLPCSLLVIVQTFHDTYMECSKKGPSSECCYFHSYMFRQVQFTTDTIQKVAANELLLSESGTCTVPLPQVLHLAGTGQWPT
ncbi:hypothetical protein BDF14DRAFT_1885328 [Spinellus fusiger]|nr:hypothetical protein BDF14DRAFT_1885328 [Spinellus fusiger]